MIGSLQFTVTSTECFFKYPVISAEDISVPFIILTVNTSTDCGLRSNLNFSHFDPAVNNNLSIFLGHSVLLSNSETTNHFQVSVNTAIHCIYNEQTNAHIIHSLLHSSIFITPTCSNTNASSSGSSYWVPAKVHKRVHAVWVVFCKKISHSLFRIVKTLNDLTILNNECASFLQNTTKTAWTHLCNLAGTE
jgi:hypothetical protein